MSNCCDVCGEENVEIVVYNNGYEICENCDKSEKYAFCENCGELIILGKHNYAEINGNYYCEECYVVCHDCNEYIADGEQIITAHGDCICDNCYNDDYITCTRCCEIVCYEESENFEGDYYCEECYNREIKDCGIHDYDYTPDYRFLNLDDENSLRDKNLHIGIELEIQGGNRLEFCNAIVNKYDFDDGDIYLKMDGSLDNESGVEIVSMPMSYRFITENNTWKDVFEQMQQYNMDDVSDCGLHFHLDKRFLNTDNIKTIDYIINTYSDFFKVIGGRDYSYYCQKREKSFDDWGRNTESRYSAVNLNNEDTVELRFCQSTDDYNIFIHRVKVIFAIVYFSKTYNITAITRYHQRWSDSCFIEKFNDIYKEIFGEFIDTTWFE